MSGEFDIIARYFAPLATEEGAFGLEDDAAFIAPYVMTKDVLVEGVHFLSKDPLDLVAKKALRVNLSDLAAKGARPAGYLLGCVWPRGVKEEAIAAFARGLSEDQEAFRVSLFGGDTTAHRAKGAPLTISVTMFGAAASAGVTRRNGARVGDDVYVTGTIGDAGLGLRALTGVIKPGVNARKFLIERYRLPMPRLGAGSALSGLATAAIDVSDGLFADAGHIAETAGVGIDIAAEKIPLSAAVSDWLNAQVDRSMAIADLASMGDDYEILFTAPQARRRSIEMAAQLTKTSIVRIGIVTRSGGVRLTSGSGEAIDAPDQGWDHFKSRENGRSDRI
ncbi:MAG: thiamine-phosphate kinase [Parvularculaceae bacterium]|nr:thiamine-phosphate kinase [Parvularculaceae bacterium]